MSYWYDDKMHRAVARLGADLTRDVHTFTTRWREEGVDWLVDGAIVHQTRGTARVDIPWEPSDVARLQRSCVADQSDAAAPIGPDRTPQRAKPIDSRSATQCRCESVRAPPFVRLSWLIDERLGASLLPSAAPCLTLRRYLLHCQCLALCFRCSRVEQMASCSACLGIPCAPAATIYGMWHGSLRLGRLHTKTFLTRR